MNWVFIGYEKMAHLFFSGGEGEGGGKGSMWPIRYQSVAPCVHPHNFLMKILRNWPCVFELCFLGGLGLAHRYERGRGFDIK